MGRLRTAAEVVREGLHGRTDGSYLVVMDKWGESFPVAAGHRYRCVSGKPILLDGESSLYHVAAVFANQALVDQFDSRYVRHVALAVGRVSFGCRDVEQFAAVEQRKLCA